MVMDFYRFPLYSKYPPNTRLSFLDYRDQHIKSFDVVKVSKNEKLPVKQGLTKVADFSKIIPVGVFSPDNKYNGVYFITEEQIV